MVVPPVLDHLARSRWERTNPRDHGLFAAAAIRYTGARDCDAAGAVTRCAATSGQSKRPAGKRQGSEVVPPTAVPHQPPGQRPAGQRSGGPATGGPATAAAATAAP